MRDDPLDNDWYALDQIEEIWERRNNAIRREPTLYQTKRDSA